MLQSIKDAADAALTDPTSTSIDWVHTVAEVVEGVEVVLAVAAEAGATTGIIVTISEFLEGAAGGVAWPVTVGVASVLAEFAAIGIGYAEAAREIKESRSASGFAHGVVMGVLKENVDFVKSNFFEWSAEQNDFWPEGGVLAQHYYNAALALGYHSGLELTGDESQLFWTDLMRGLTSGLGDPEAAAPEDREREWINWYIAAGVQFQKLHIEH
jgi:hypothetical protein